MKPAHLRSPFNERGFTLLEVLVALVLMAMVTLAAALSLRLAVDAAERISDEGDSRQVLGVLPAVLAKQLAMVRIVDATGSVKQPSMHSAMNVLAIGKPGLKKSEEEEFAQFRGSAHSISFLTAYARQGSSFQGLSWVQYVYEPTDQTLSIYQQTITKIEDASGSDKPISRKARKAEQRFAPELVGRIERVSRFELSYAEDSDADPQEDAAWEREWEGSGLGGLIDIGVPAQVALEMEIGGQRGRKGGRWVFAVGTSLRLSAGG